MPTLLESTDYDKFDYKGANEKPLALEEAIKKAESLRLQDQTMFYRIVPTDSDMSGFRVEKVTPEEVYERLLRRFASLRARLAARKL